MALPEIEIRVSADTRQAEQGLTNVSDRLGQVSTAAPAAQQSTGRFGTSLRNLGNVSNQTRGRIQQVGFQLQDIAVQMQAGTRTSTVMAQQLPQLAGAFGAVGAAVGTVIAIGVPLAAFLLGNTDRARTLAEVLDGLRERSQGLEDAVEALARDNDELAESFGRSADAARDNLRALVAQDVYAAQRAIDDLSASLAEMFSVSEGVQTGRIADFFDVNILLAFTDAQRQSREEARLLTSQFISMQGELASGGMSLREQGDQLTRMREVAENLAALNGTITDQEAELIRQLAEAANEAYRMAEGVEAAAGSGANLNAWAQTFGDRLEWSADLLAEFAHNTEETTDEAESLRDKHERIQRIIEQIASASFDSFQAQVIAAAEATGLAADEAERWLLAMNGLANMTTGEFFTGDGGLLPPSVGADKVNQGNIGHTPGGGGGGGGGGFGGRIAALVESLQTERETVEAWYQESLELLGEANAAELEAIGGHNEARLRLEEEYQRRLAGIREAGHGDALTSILNSGQQIATAIGQTNERAMRVAQAFGAAEALVNAYRAASQALADPTLPWFAKVSAAASVLAAGIGFANSIRSISPSGNGAGAAASATSADTAAPAVSRNVAIQLTGGNMFSRDQVIELINGINEAVEDGAIVRLV